MLVGKIYSKINEIQSFCNIEVHHIGYAQDILNLYIMQGTLCMNPSAVCTRVSLLLRLRTMLNEEHMDLQDVRKVRQMGINI